MSDTATNGSNGRGSTGRFSAGNKFGNGNPLARRAYVLRAALLATASREDVQKVARKLLDLATEGDVQAIKLYLEYTLGKPTQAVELSGPDGTPLGSLDVRLVTQTIFAALAPFPPEIRAAVAERLGTLTDGDRPEPPALPR